MEPCIVTHPQPREEAVKPLVSYNCVDSPSAAIGCLHFPGSWDRGQKLFDCLFPTSRGMGRKSPVVVVIIIILTNFMLTFFWGGETKVIYCVVYNGFSAIW